MEDKMIYIGTAGYSYKDWIGNFYPEGTKEKFMLDYYSQQFDFVEVNSSYYHMPRRVMFESMNEKTPDSFRFAVKLFQGFTHERGIGENEANQFKQSLSPLIESKKLLCVLAQFPYSFHYNNENSDYLKRIREWFCDVEVSVEFRNDNWIRSEVISLLKKESLGFVCVDQPRIKGLIKNVIASTSNISYLRMHGRNSAKWYGGKDSERYNYLYSREELLEWVGGIRELESNSHLTVISFNNHPLGKAVENARTMAAILKEM